MRLLLFVITFFCFGQSFAQRFSSGSFMAHKKVSLKTGESIEEQNMFLISKKEKRLVHIKTTKKGKNVSRFYKLISMEEIETDKYEFKSKVQFKSKLHDHEIFIVIKEGRNYIVGEKFEYACQVFPCWPY